MEYCWLSTSGDCWIIIVGYKKYYICLVVSARMKKEVNQPTISKLLRKIKQIKPRAK